MSRPYCSCEQCERRRQRERLAGLRCRVEMALEDGDADTAIDAARDIIRVQAEIAKLDCAIEIDERAKLELTGLARRLTAGLLDGTRHLPRHGGRDREE